MLIDEPIGIRMLLITNSTHDSDHFKIGNLLKFDNYEDAAFYASSFAASDYVKNFKSPSIKYSVVEFHTDDPDAPIYNNIKSITDLDIVT